ncbi:PQQ-binding-like beta-propeller repeat protein [Halobium salinum]|uniref:PQQ-binding-like beta-propeller repeat protein n=1 Tax=Halobium salinum TaxID=1364940 RepID=A0ABD5P8E9_9EURY|nr:PQQ-binding-like beta-propeller repeat protein [Halobium salinum]
MRTRTSVAVALLVVALAGVGAVALAGGVGWVGGVGGIPGLDAGGTLTERWVSDTARDTQTNHHAVGVGPEGRVVVAPVAIPKPGSGLPAADACSLVRLDPASGAVDWRASVPPEHCFSHALTAPTVADADGDGESEVAVGTTQDAVVVYDTDGSEAYRVPLASYGYAPPTVANLTPEAGPELVALDIGGAVTAANGETVLWRSGLDESAYAAPHVGDTDGDGEPEVLVGTGKRVALLDSAGYVEWSTSAPAATMTVAETESGTVAFAAGVRHLAAVDAADGSVRWEREPEANPAVGAVRDGDDDGANELYVAFNDGRVVAYDAATGEREWEATVSTETTSAAPPPALGDLDGDGEPELVAPTNGGSVHVLDPADGSTLATYERDSLVWTHPTLADLDGDGGDEVLVRYGDGRVVALDYES